jgi:hypothetical protein
LCINICNYFAFFLKKNLLCTLRLNIPCAFNRRHGHAFELTCVSSTTAPHHIHTLLHACVRTHHICSNAEPTSRTHTKHECDQTHPIRSIACVFGFSCDPFRSLFLPFFPIFSLTAVQLSSLLPQIPPPKPPNIQIPPPPIISTTTTAPPWHLCTTTTHRRPSNHHHFQFFSSFSHRNLNHPKTPIVLSFLFIQGHKSTHGLCPLNPVLVFYYLQGVGLIFKGLPKPFIFGLHTRCSIKRPNKPPACLEGEVRLPSHPSPMPLLLDRLLRVGSSFWRTPLPSKRSSPTMRLLVRRSKS